MAEIVNSLFGLPSQDVRNQMLQRQSDFSNQYASTYNDPTDRRNALLGGAVGNALANFGAGLFGVQDPALKRATDLERILGETQQEVGADPTLLYPALQQKLADAGYSREAMQVAQAGQKALQEQGLNVAKIDNEKAQSAKFRAEATKALKEGNPTQALFFKLAEKASPQSVQKALAAGMDISLLDTPDNTVYSPLARQLIEANFKPGTPEFANKMLELIDAEKTGKSKGSGNVSVNVGGIAIDSGKLSEEAGKAVGKDVAGIENKYSALDSISDALSMVDAGINAGFYGPAKQFVGKASGGMIGSQEKVENTERFMSYIGNVVIPRLQEFGGNDSVEELKYLRQVMAGEITLEPNSIKRILQDADKKIKRGIERTQRQVESASTGTAPPLDAGPSRTQPKATKRYNRQTGKFEDIK